VNFGNGSDGLQLWRPSFYCKCARRLESLGDSVRNCKKVARRNTCAGDNARSARGSATSTNFKIQQLPVAKVSSNAAGLNQDCGESCLSLVTSLPNVAKIRYGRSKQKPNALGLGGVDG
jgi:hypothetical protein